MTDTEPVTSVIIPAHDEAAVIGRLLTTLLSGAKPGEFDVIVVCNGCSDDTAELARAYGPDVRVIELSEPSKRSALIEGDRQARCFPRVYADADVVLDAAAVRALVAALAEPGIYAAAPARQDVLERSSWAVRAYYRVWSRLPAVQYGLFGRGVLAVNEDGFKRISDRPAIMGDDLYVDSRFTTAERRVVPQAKSDVYAPLRVADLLLRRTRAAHGNAELSSQTGGRTDTTGSSARALARMVLREPQRWPDMIVFGWVTTVARRRAARASRANRPVEWLRDESTRR